MNRLRDLGWRSSISTPELFFQKTKDRPNVQTMFFNMMPDILDSPLRSSVVKEVRLEQKPLHSNERERVVSED